MLRFGWPEFECTNIRGCSTVNKRASDIFKRVCMNNIYVTLYIGVGCIYPYIDQSEPFTRDLSTGHVNLSK